MHIDSYFSLSNSSLEDAEYVIFGIPYDATQTFNPGSRFAPNSVRVSSWNLEEYSVYFRHDLKRVKVCDAGNVNCDGSFRDVAERVDDLVSGLGDAIPVAIGGEHTVSYAIVRSIMRRCDEMRYVVFDAHFDLRDEFDSNKFSHACNLRRILEIDGVEAIIVGVRSGCEEEVRFAEERGIELVHPWENSWLSRVEEFIGDRKFYVSLDVDVFDPSFAPEVSTPEPFGIEPAEFLKFLSVISGSKDGILGFDVVELVPSSASSTTSVLVAKMIFEFIAAIDSG